MTWDELLTFVDAESLRLADLYKDTASASELRMAQFAKLSEEVGELAEQVLAANSLQRKEKKLTADTQALGAEIADVIIVTLLVAKAYGVDPTTALKQKMLKIQKRYQ